MGHAIGHRCLAVRDIAQDAIIELNLLYPSGDAPRLHHVGSYPLELARDGRPVPGPRALVVLSHGDGGTPWVHRDLAIGLARHGFVVAMPKHPGNSLNDNALAGSLSNLENRPRHLRLCVDAALADPMIGTNPAARVAMIGHSMGGYSVLAAAGGQPWSGGAGMSGGPPRPIAVTRDRRIAALVLLAPATRWFGAPGALSGVDMPILMRFAEHDALIPPRLADIVRQGVPDAGRIACGLVAGAGHFSFLSPFPPHRIRSDFPPSQDPPGFDRAAYQAVLLTEIGEFLRRTMRIDERGVCEA
ncbi:serine aminopeptidase domain-containing protein [Nguyenibacter sp. L1]|uniref:alpha/beta hydrolase family protein n=1 Tax=Nguyenibacter sp. L1 TaxID=3049350 RepID=UPI002B4605D1|nr:alpha/beta hydrolase [Nguyenibacter sp. L1]WRH87391.1 alpha/beta hydrolase [Nguyenibacter sp. L1]